MRSAARDEIVSVVNLGLWCEVARFGRISRVVGGRECHDNQILVCRVEYRLRGELATELIRCLSLLLQRDLAVFVARYRHEHLDTDGCEGRRE